MSALIAPLWSAPAGDVPELQLQAYRLMMYTLNRVRARFPTLLSNPADLNGKEVLEAAASRLLNPKIPKEIRTGALGLLEHRMRQVDPTTPRYEYLARDAYRHPLAANFNQQLEDLDTFEQALQSFIRFKLARLDHAPDSPPSDQDALLSLGILEALLVTRGGYCWLALLARLIRHIGHAPCVYGPSAWLDVDMGETGNVPQLRRVFLDPVVLAAWMRLMPVVDVLPDPPRGLKAGKLARFYLTRTSQAFTVLANAMTLLDTPSPITSLQTLCTAETQRLYATTMPLLATYARGEIASSSLESSTWCRLLGCAASAAPQTGSTAHARSSTEKKGLPPDTIARPSPAEGIAQGDLDEEGWIAKLREATRGPRTTWDQSLAKLVKELRSSTAPYESVLCVIGWLRYLTTDYRNKGHRLRDGSVRYYRGLLAQRLLQHLPRTLHDIDDETLHDAYAEVIESRTSDGQSRNLRMALGVFDRYVRTHLYPQWPRTTFIATGGSHAISNRIISQAEFAQGLQQVDDGSLVVSAADIRLQVKAFWILAFRLGMRRREILGLQVRDIEGALVHVRKNAQRPLKTPNAHRLLTLFPLPEEERHTVQALAHDRPLEEFLFFDRATPSDETLDSHPVVGFINALLERITGDRRLHPHNLRHSFATHFVLANLGPDFDIAAHPCAADWMTAEAKVSVTMAANTTGALHQLTARGAALGMLMGHGSELTTYEHYVHCLDILLFVATTHPAHSLHRGSTRQQLASARAQIRSLLHLPRSNWLPGETLFDVTAQLTDRYASHFVVLTKHRSPAAAPSEPATKTGRWLPTLNELRAASNPQARGSPHTQAQRDSADALLSRLGSIDPRQRTELVTLLRQWDQARIKSADWASMSGDEALTWVESMYQLTPSVEVEVLQVTRDAKGNTKHKRPIAHPRDTRAYDQQGARYWVRFADLRSHTRKRPAPERRSRTQASITWLVGIVVSTAQ